MRGTALPTGAVVFLFSDIEGSTRRWEAETDAMRDALRRHDEILRNEIERRRGYVFKTIGDAFCAAFSSIGDALRSAVEIQRRIEREDFRSVGGIAVRMSIHAGEADERSGDYFGPAVNRTARLLSTGHGGQILLSGLAADLALPALPDGILLRHLGTLPLRDLKEPERVYQPVGPGLRSDFKPLRALETPPNNLPRQLTSFVGREEEVVTVGALLDGSAVVTIVGAGGIGKTRFALEMAASRLNDQRDGAWFVDLSAIADAGLISGAILSALDAQPSSGREPIDDVVEYLSKRELLLVLDNCEQLVGDVAAIVSRIATQCPHVGVLATSREPLDISGERVYRLSSLDLASAVKLFTDRARAADPNFDAAANAATIESICTRVDGMALAIELAAARVRMMSPQDLAHRLELRMLAGGRDRLPRQQTIGATIDWSYDLLRPEEQRCLRRCAIFSGGFSLGVAKEVCSDGDPWDLLERLSSLVDKSLVVLESGACEGRYRLLEPIRQYAAEKLDASGETAEIARRHAGAYAMLARAAYEEWDNGPQPDWMLRLQLDVQNLRDALRWSIEERNDRELGARLTADTTPAFLRLALLPEGRAWCERVLDDDMPLDKDVEARLRYGLSMLYSNIGANKKVLEQALVAVSLYREAGDARGLAQALSQVAARYAPQARYDDALAAAEEALQIARESGDRRLLADTLRRCAQAFAGEGREAVRARYEQSVALFRTLGRNYETARALEWWSQWEAESGGDFRSAAELMLEAGRLDDRDIVKMFTLNDVAGYYLATGDFARAEPMAREALVTAAKARHPVLTALSIAYIAVIEGLRDHSRAARLVGYAAKALRAAEWQLVPFEQKIVDRLFEQLARTIEESELARLLEVGAALNEDEAVAEALSG